MYILFSQTHLLWALVVLGPPQENLSFLDDNRFPMDLGGFLTCGFALFSDFELLGSRNYFLAGFPNDSAWVCVEEPNKHVKTTKTHCSCIKFEQGPQKTKKTGQSTP